MIFFLHIAQPFRQYGGFVPMIYPYTSRVDNHDPRNIARSDRRNPEVAEQNFFPSFFRNPTTHSRPYKSVATNAGSIAGRYRASGRSQNFDQSILGSGDFAVIRGGTFYPNDDQNAYIKNSEEFFGGFFNNGHGRPNAQPLKTRKQPYYPDDPFEHFTDFADINTGNEAAFSHFKVIYANKNSTNSPLPKNILEKLQLLDFERKLQSNEDAEEINDKKLIKLSNFKSKLAKTKVVKKYTKNLGPKQKDTSTDNDPLLATS